MVHADEIARQLKRIGANTMFFGRPELRELPKILFEGEQLEHIVNGRYEAGWALLVATNMRLLLIDKKPFYLTIEDLRYDMISDVEFNHRLLDASIKIGAMHKTLSYLSYSHSKLRLMTTYVQEKVMAARQQQLVMQHQMQPPQQAPAEPQATFAQVLQPLEQDQPSGQQYLGGSAIRGMLRPPVNPYNVPFVVRRRVSRFY